MATICPKCENPGPQDTSLKLCYICLEVEYKKAMRVVNAASQHRDQCRVGPADCSLCEALDAMASEEPKPEEGVKDE